MSELIFIDKYGNQSRVNISDHCKIELAIQDGNLVKSRIDTSLNFISVKTSGNVDKTTENSIIR